MRAWLWERRIIRHTFGTVDVVTRDEDEEERGEDIEGVKRRRSMRELETEWSHEGHVGNRTQE